MIEFIGNRAAKLLKRAATEIESDENVLLCYWDTYGDPLPGFDESQYSLCLRVLPRPITNPIDDKGQLGEILRARSDLLPCTYADKSAIPYVRSRADGLWFIKNRYGAGGKQVSCARYDELSGLELSDNDVLQQAVTDLDLINGRKYTLRCYMLIWNGKAYLHRYYYRVIHGEPYKADATDYGIQVSLRYSGGGTEFEPVTDTATNARFDELLRVHRALAREFAFIVEESTRETFSLLGCDFLVERSGRARLIEVNAYPNLVHLDSAIASQVIYPMVKDAVATMVHGEPRGNWESLA